jgi:hypothetical protein
MAGCAEFPKNSSSQFTRLTFSITMAGNIPSPNSLTDPGLYQYYVVMSLFTGSVPPQIIQSQEIAPIVGGSTTTGNSANQIFTGYATNCVAYNLAAAGNPYAIYDFNSTPIDMESLPLGQVAGYTNDILPSLDSNFNYPPTWGFTVFLNQLQPTDTQTYTYIVFQVISMNVLAGQSGRYMDALGDSSSFNETEPVAINLNTSYNTSQPTLVTVPQVPLTIPSGGDPALQIQSVTLTVSTPS